jgi:hypothetical protein
VLLWRVPALPSQTLAYFVESLPSHHLPCVFIPLARYTDFDIVQLLHLSAIDIQGKPFTIHVGHYGSPTVTHSNSKDPKGVGTKAHHPSSCAVQRLHISCCRHIHQFHCELLHLFNPTPFIPLNPTHSKSPYVLSSDNSNGGA